MQIHSEMTELFCRICVFWQGKRGCSIPGLGKKKEKKKRERETGTTGTCNWSVDVET